MHSDFINAVDEQGTQVIQTPGDFTSLCHSCEVEIMKPFKTQLAEMFEA